MGRIDEALRRSGKAALLSLPGDDAEAIAREAFGDGQPGQDLNGRRVDVAAAGRAEPERAAATVSPEQAHGSAPEAAKAGAPAAGPATADQEVAARRRLLFERLDARLAQKVVVDTNILPASREQYRRLAASLHQTQATTGLQVVMIASALAGEGKSLTAANLALTFSESYQRRVLLIDADLRRPTQHQLFQIDGTSGLGDGLLAPDDRPLPLERITPRLTVLPAGTPILDPMAAITSDRMRRLLDEARGAFDWVIIDTPPVGILSDASLLAGMADGAVLVVKAGETPFALVKKAADAFGQGRLLGVVLNRATVQPNRYDYYSRYYGSGYPAAAPRQD
jgi:capsular exopolysaccharide synthesis family protein